MTTEKDRMLESIAEARNAWAEAGLDSGGSPAGYGGYLTAMGLLAAAIFNAKTRKVGRKIG